MTPNAKEHVSAMADRIRRGIQPASTLGITMIDWINEAWRYEDTRADAELIRNNFPQYFPLSGARAAE